MKWFFSSPAFKAWLNQRFPDPTGQTAGHVPQIQADGSVAWAEAVGVQGPEGPQGPAGPAGADGVNGADGADGVGVPAGGAAGEVLQKVDGTDYNTAWAAPASAPTGVVLPTVGALAPAGWIILTGASAVRSIGNGSSGADRANADTAALYSLLWDSMADAQAPVTGGRGVDAATDFAAGKALTIPEALGRAIIGAGAGAGLTARTHGATGGAETHQLSVAELAAHTHSALNNASAGGPGSAYYVANHTVSGSAGSDMPHNNMQPWLALNFICKL